MIELFLKKSAKEKITLLEPFVDFEVKLRSFSRFKKYETERTIKPLKYPYKVRISKIERMVERLQKNYPDKNYRLQMQKLWKKVRDGMKMVKLWVISRGEPCLDNPPLYYLPKEGRFFIPQEYVESRYRLCCAVVVYRLNDLRIPLETR